MPDLYDLDALSKEFSAFTLVQLRIALDRVAQHPSRGPKTSRRVIAETGLVVNGAPRSGVAIRRDGNEYRFRLTEVNGTAYTWDELVMGAASFPGFVTALRDLLHRPEQ